jgi:membrane protease YdiL (CAAX protease family)
MDTAKIKRETLILSTALVFLTDPVLQKLFVHYHFSHLMVVGLTRIAQTVMVLWIILLFEKSVWSLGLAADQFFEGIRKGAVWSLSFAVVAVIAYFVMKIFHINGIRMFKVGMPSGTKNLVLYYVIGGVIAPIAEEIYFRGVVFGFMKKWGFPFALFMSTGIFAAFHILFSGVRYPISQIVGGFVFAISYEMEKSLWVPIFIHAAGNMAIFTLSML